MINMRFGSRWRMNLESSAIAGFVCQGLNRKALDTEAPIHAVRTPQTGQLDIICPDAYDEQFLRDLASMGAAHFTASYQVPNFQPRKVASLPSMADFEQARAELLEYLPEQAPTPQATAAPLSLLGRACSWLRRLGLH